MARECHGISLISTQVYPHSGAEVLVYPSHVANGTKEELTTYVLPKKLFLNDNFDQPMVRECHSVSHRSTKVYPH